MFLENFPQLYGFVVRGYQKPRRISALVTPPQRVDFLLNLKALQVVKLGFVGLELGEVPALVIKKWLTSRVGRVLDVYWTMYGQQSG